MQQYGESIPWVIHSGRTSFRRERPSPYAIGEIHGLVESVMQRDGIPAPTPSADFSSIGTSARVCDLAASGARFAVRHVQAELMIGGHHAANEGSFRGLAQTRRRVESVFLRGECSCVCQRMMQIPCNGSQYEENAASGGHRRRRCFQRTMKRGARNGTVDRKLHDGTTVRSLLVSNRNEIL